MDPKPKPGIQVAPWPDGNRRRSSWWILDYTEGRGYSPVAGPYGNREAADTALATMQARAQIVGPWREVFGARRYTIFAALPDDDVGTRLANTLCEAHPWLAVLGTWDGRIYLAHKEDKGTPRPDPEDVHDDAMRSALGDHGQGQP